MCAAAATADAADVVAAASSAARAARAACCPVTAPAARRHPQQPAACPCACPHSAPHDSSSALLASAERWRAFFRMYSLIRQGSRLRGHYWLLIAIPCSPSPSRRGIDAARCHQPLTALHPPRCLQPADHTSSQPRARLLSGGRHGGQPRFRAPWDRALQVSTRAIHKRVDPYSGVRHVFQLMCSPSPAEAIVAGHLGVLMQKSWCRAIEAACSAQGHKPGQNATKPKRVVQYRFVNTATTASHSNTAARHAPTPCLHHLSTLSSSVPSGCAVGEDPPYSDMIVRQRSFAGARRPSARGAGHASTVARGMVAGGPPERVLRYPNGEERRIIYPACSTQDDDSDEYMAWDVTGFGSLCVAPSPKALAAAALAAGSRAASRRVQVSLHRTSCPGARRPLRAVFEFLSGVLAGPAIHHHKSQQRAAAGPSDNCSLFGKPFCCSLQRCPTSREGGGHVSGEHGAARIAPHAVQCTCDADPPPPFSQQVLSGCPYVLPRPVFVLAQQRYGDPETGGSYTLRVRMEQQGASGDLAKVRLGAA